MFSPKTQGATKEHSKQTEAPRKGGLGLSTSRPEDYVMQMRLSSQQGWTFLTLQLVVTPDAQTTGTGYVLGLSLSRQVDPLPPVESWLLPIRVSDVEELPHRVMAAMAAFNAVSAEVSMPFPPDDAKLLALAELEVLTDPPS